MVRVFASNPPVQDSAVARESLCRIRCCAVVRAKVIRPKGVDWLLLFQVGADIGDDFLVFGPISPMIVFGANSFVIFLVGKQLMLAAIIIEIVLKREIEIGQKTDGADRKKYPEQGCARQGVFGAKVILFCFIFNHFLSPLQNWLLNPVVFGGAVVT